MNIWVIIFAIAINALWIVPFVLEIIIYPLKKNIEYNRRFKKWNLEHPGLIRKYCMDCKYCKKETTYVGRYHHTYPKRYPVYCRFLGIRLSYNCEHQRCKIAEPTLEFIETNKKKYPENDTTVYFSDYGDSYHSTPLCTSIKNSKYVRKAKYVPSDRRPCLKCWIEIDNKIYPKN